MNIKDNLPKNGILSKSQDKLHKNMLQRILKIKHDIDEIFFNSIFFKIKNLSPNQKGEHLLFNYLEEIFTYNKKPNNYILFHLIKSFTKLKIKKTFTKHPCLICVKFKKYSILKMLFESIDPFIKTTKNIYLLEEIFNLNNNFFNEYELGVVPKSENLYYSDFFRFCFKNSKILYAINTKEWFKTFFINLITNNKTKNKKKLDLIYNFWGYDNMIIISDNIYLDIYDKNSNMKIFLEANKDVTKKIYSLPGEKLININFDIYDDKFSKLTDEQIKNINQYTEIYKKFLLSFFINKDQYLCSKKIETFENILSKVSMTIIKIEKQKNILQDEKPFYIYFISHLITYQIFFSCRSNF